MEKSLILVKPDGIQRGLIGEIISRFEKKGLKLVAIKMVEMDDKIINNHYKHHIDKPFFQGLKQYMQSCPIVAMVWEGVETVESVRILCGTTKSRNAEAGSIRGDLAMSVQLNLVHASDSKVNAEKEIKTFFTQDEIFDYHRTLHKYIYSADEC